MNAAEVTGLEQSGQGNRSARFTPLFVGGVPRSGSTILHALLCTSEKTNPYIGECSYLSAFMVPYEVGLVNFEIHTRHYFPSIDHFSEHHAQVLTRELTHIWEQVGRPEVLALKDPMLTPSFPRLAALLKSALFVIAVRDPRDTIASRIEVMRRAHKDFRVRPEFLQQLCAEYVRFYGAIHDNKALFGERLHWVEYEALVRGAAMPALENLGLGKIEPEHVWKESITNVHDYQQNAWSTPLYGQKISTASVGHYKTILSPQAEACILAQCGELARAIGLPMEVTRALPKWHARRYRPYLQWLPTPAKKILLHGRRLCFPQSFNDLQGLPRGL